MNCRSDYVFVGNGVNLSTLEEIIVTVHCHLAEDLYCRYNMASMMDTVHSLGVSMIQYLQLTFKDESELMLFLSHVGDPRNAFLIYFPIAYFLHQSVGKRVVWVAAISEWLNAVFKFILHGERPYWWAEESDVYNNTTRPHLLQYRLTCETGPGSPSGHAMVTSSVLFILVTEFLYYGQIKSILVRGLSWLVFGVVMLAVNVSRLYIATHFPHQVLAGVIVGSVIGYIFNSFSTTSLTFRHHVIAALTFIFTTLMTYGAIESMGLDAMWSVAKAKKWCAQSEWVYLDTTLFYSVVRDAFSLLGLGLALFVLPKVDDSGQSLTNRLVHMSMSLVIARITDSYKLPHHPVHLFYILSCLKFSLLFIIIVNIVPRINLFSNPSKTRKQKIS